MDENENVVIELTCFTQNIDMDSVRVLNFFPFKQNMKNGTHNMLSLMLDPILKCFFCLVSLLKNDRKSLHPMFLKCHHHLHPLIEYKMIFFITI